VHVLKRTLESPDNTIALTSDLEHVASSVEGLRGKLEMVSNYVERVISGEIKEDPKIGRYLLDTVSAIPKLETEEFEKMFNNSLQDLLMVVYMANLTRTQVLLAEKLTTV
jgi:translation initiation factor 3 subunit F